MSVRNGRRLTRKEKGWDHTSKEGLWRMCIEEPFNITRNLGNSADSTAFRGIHLELRRAFDLLADGGQLEKCCEQYQFPPEEKGIFKKPITGPKPILSAIPIQPARAGRGGSNSRNGRSNNGQRNGQGYRRSSSGAAFGRSQQSPFVQSPPLGVVGHDYLSATIQEQLLQQSNYYGLQIQQLKERMAIQQSQIQAAAHAHSVVQGSSQSSRDASATVSPQKTPYLNGASSPRMTSAAFYPEYLSYPYDTQQMVPSVSQDGSRTNPSSPSLSTTAPARRTMQRSSLASDGSVRSQSQPPRGGVPQTLMYPQFGHFIPGYGLQYAYAVPSSAQDHVQAQSSIDVPVGYDPLSRATSLPTRDSSPKEYVGYYMHGPRRIESKLPPQPPHVPSFGNIPQIPQYSELAHRRNRPSQELHLSLNAGRRVSRSPSPSGHHRTFSTPMRASNLPLRSAPLPIPAFISEQNDPSPQHREPPTFAPPSGLLIVNGSSYPSSTIENRSNPSEEDFSMDEPVSAVTSREEPFRQEDLSNTSARPPSMFEAAAPNQRHSPPMVQTTNGFSYQSACLESEGGFSSPLQPFPSLDPAMLPSKPDEDHVVSPRSVQHPPWRVPQTLKPSVPPIDTSKGQDPSKQSEPKTAPLLSPVYETRTPSPTAHRRRSDHIRNPSLNGIFPLINGGTGKENGTANGRSHVPRTAGVPPTPTGKSTTVGPSISADKSPQSKTPSATSTTSGWQTTGKSKKKKNRQRSQSGAVIGSNSTPRRGEPMPTNEAERKGG
jgi:hypothetical protein